jgi:phosphoenolpyruvate carboxykinase (ATP)
MEHIGPHISKFGVDRHGLGGARRVFWNLPTGSLYEEAIRRGEGRIAEGGPFVALTGEHTGRSANDKYIVRNPESENDIWWGKVNVPIAPAAYTGLKQRLLAYFEGRDAFVQDCWAGTAKRYRLGVRVITETAWHSLFARNMFIEPTVGELGRFEPGFTIIHAPGFEADPARDGTRSGTFIVTNFEDRTIIIGGTSYAGEIKKGVFSVLNFLLPARDVLPMHCSVNVGSEGDAAMFFGLSGTGKTTLSADPHRQLVGDDEHGWSADGLFNFEGGCYAKVIRLSPEAEPEIFAASSRYGTVLENVVTDPVSGAIDFDDGRYTENTRSSYPIDFIPNVMASGVADHPANIVMLTADAFGVLPPISRLTAEQAMYHFISGYTAKVAGTEKGLGNEPQATFSTCFGAPFMPRHPSVYAGLLGRKINETGAACWLVNTGWTGGAFGVGERMSIRHTRTLLNSALHGVLDDVAFTPDPHFGLAVPASCPGVPAGILDPRGTWADKGAYDAQAGDLVARFNANFVQFEDYVETDVRAAAPRAA